MMPAVLNKEEMELKQKNNENECDVFTIGNANDKV